MIKSFHNHPIYPVDPMTKSHLLFLPSFLVCLLVSLLRGDEPHPSLKELIAESRKQTTFRVIGFERLEIFDQHWVRKNFFGDEAAFRREVASLLQTGEDQDVEDALDLIGSLDIDDEAIFKIVRDRFASLKGLGIGVLVTNPTKGNVDFLVGLLNQSDSSVHVLFKVADALSWNWSLIKERYYSAPLETELKNSIVDAFLSHIDDEREILLRFRSSPAKLGDEIAWRIGYFSSSAKTKTALPKIREKFEKFIAAQDGTDVDLTTLRLAWAILRIAPQSPESKDALEFILKTMDESEWGEREGIDLLKSVSSVFAEKTIPRLLSIIQKETDISDAFLASGIISHKVLAAEAIQEILEDQLNRLARRMNHRSEEGDE